jgi:stage II sporulation protein AA (anti-sigma F factor antagonist)
MADAAHLNVSTDVAGDEVVVRLTGELDLDGAGAVTETLVGLGTGDVRHVVVNASEITFLDSSGLRALLSAREQLDKVDVVLRVDSPSPAVERVLEMTGTRQLLGA